MTWLRWDVETPQSDVVGYLATSLGCGIAQALGHYFACCSGFGQHRPDGMVNEVTDATLEHWALWAGKPGRFAAAFRARCVGDDGTVRGWWRNQAVIRKQERDRKKPDGRKNRESRADNSGDSEGIRGGNDTTTTTPSGSTIRESAVVGESQAAQRITVALNRGLRDNSRIGEAFNAVIAAAGTQVVVDWLRLGIPVEFAEQAVYGLAKAYAGEGQISSLSYCDKPVRKAWARDQSRADNDAVGPRAKAPAEKPATTRLRRV